MRITKEPEVRKQEILDTALKMCIRDSPATGSLCGPRLAGGDGLARELTREEKRAIRALVTKWCANYDRECGCLPLDCECYLPVSYTHLGTASLPCSRTCMRSF